MSADKLREWVGKRKEISGKAGKDFWFPDSVFIADSRNSADKYAEIVEVLLAELETHCTGFVGCNACNAISKAAAIIKGEK